MLGTLRARRRPPPGTPARRPRRPTARPDRLLPGRAGGRRVPGPARPARHAPAGAQHGGDALGGRRGGRLRPRALASATGRPAAPARRLAPHPQLRLRHHRRTPGPPRGPAVRATAPPGRLRAHRRAAARLPLHPLPRRTAAARHPSRAGRPARGRCRDLVAAAPRPAARPLRTRPRPHARRPRGTRPHPRPAPRGPAAARHRPRPLPPRPGRARPAGPRVRRPGRPPAGAVRRPAGRHQGPAPAGRKPAPAARPGLRRAPGGGGFGCRGGRRTPHARARRHPVRTAPAGPVGAGVRGLRRLRLPVPHRDQRKRRRGGDGVRPGGGPARGRAHHPLAGRARPGRHRRPPRRPPGLGRRLAPAARRPRRPRGGTTPGGRDVP